MDKLYQAIGLCMKAGKAQSGATACEQAIRRGKAKIVLLERGASDATKAHYAAMCESHGVPLYTVDAVGSAIGKDSRIVLAVTDAGFQKMIEGAMPDIEK